MYKPNNLIKIAMLFPNNIIENDSKKLARVTKWKRLTPKDYDRNIFHIELDISGLGIKYEIGDALGISPQNSKENVDKMLDLYTLTGDEVIEINLDDKNKSYIEIISTRQLFTSFLDIFGRPSKKFYKDLIKHVYDIEEKVAIATIGDRDGEDQFIKRLNESYSYYDILKEFHTARPSIEDLIELIPPIQERHYSIASSSKMYPNSIHLLIVAVNWETPSGKLKYGLCTKYLVDLEKEKDAMVSVSIMKSKMRLPKDASKPIIMAGLGTGMAPFRAFIQEKAYMKRKGVNIGPVSLYFGSRYKSKEYLYGDELEMYKNEGVITNLRLAFSRDYNFKMYIQHKIATDEEQICDYLINQKGTFYLCGPTWPEKEIKETLVINISNYYNISKSIANDLLCEIDNNKRYLLEVY